MFVLDEPSTWLLIFKLKNWSASIWKLIDYEKSYQCRFPEKYFHLQYWQSGENSIKTPSSNCSYFDYSNQMNDVAQKSLIVNMISQFDEIFLFWFVNRKVDDRNEFTLQKMIYHSFIICYEYTACINIDKVFIFSRSPFFRFVNFYWPLLMN